MFILGVLVGRGTAPIHFDIQELQKELAALKMAYLQKEITRYKINAPETIDKSDLGFHEALKSPERKAPVPTKPDRKNAASSPKKKSSPPDPRHVKPAAKSDEVPSTAMDESGRRYTIQVASSQKMSDADKMVARLKAKGYPAYLESAQIPGKGTWYRVRIGGFRNRTEADRFLAILKKENVKGIVLKR